MTKRNPILLAGVGLFIFAMLLSTIIIPVATTKTQTVEGDTTYSLSLSFLDQYGQPMATQPFMLVDGGGGAVEASAIVLTCTWAATGTEIDWPTFRLDLTLKMIETHPSDGFVWYFEEVLQIPIEYGSHVFTIHDTDVPDILDGAEHTILFWVDFVGTATDNVGRPVTRSTSDNVGCIISTELGVLDIVGTVAADADLNIVAFSAVETGLNPLYNPAMATLLVGVLLVATQVFSPRKG